MKNKIKNIIYLIKKIFNGNTISEINFFLKFKKALFTLLFTTILLFCSLNVYAASYKFQELSFLNLGDINVVYDDGDDTSLDLSDYPFVSKSPQIIGFDSLYNSKKDFINYYGEIPYVYKLFAEKQDDDSLDGLRYYNGFTIGRQDRLWSRANISDIKNNGIIITDIKSKDATSEDKLGTINSAIKTSSEDLHLKALTVKHGSFEWLRGLGFTIMNGINSLFMLIVNLLISLKGLNLGTILSSIDKSGSFAKQLSTIFLINPDTNDVSPFLVIGLILFLISFVALCFNMVKGKESARKAINELGFLILAVIIAAIFLIPSNVNKISSTGLDFLTSLSNEIATNSNSTTQVYKYATGETNKDNTYTQKGLIKKIYIDQIIATQFGYKVNQLDILNDDGTTSDFGNTNEVLKALQLTFGDDATLESMQVMVGNNCGTNNLGYYFWASNSPIKTTNDWKNNPVFNKKSGQPLVIGLGSSDRLLFTIDFLNNLRTVTTDNAIKQKIDKIMTRLEKPAYASAVVNILGVFLNNVALSYGLFMIIIFCMIGQVIVVFGSYCMVVMPTLYLFKQTRSTARKMLYTYLFSFLRYLIGCALFNVILTISVLLSQQGFGGVILSCLISVMMGYFGPNLLKELNLYLMRIERSKGGAPMMSGVYHKLDNIYGKHTVSGRHNAKRNRYKVNADGTLTNDKTFGDKIQDGIKRGENPFSNNGDPISQTGINPFGEKRKEYKKNKALDIIEENKNKNDKNRFNNYAYDENDKSIQEVKNKGVNEDLLNKLNQLNNNNSSGGNTLNNGKGLNLNISTSNDNLFDEDELDNLSKDINIENNEKSEISQQRAKEIIKQNKKDQKEAKRQASKQTAAINAAGYIPIIGKSIQQHMVEEIKTKEKTKQEVMDEMVKIGSTSNMSLSADELYDLATNNILQNTDNRSKQGRGKALEEAKNKITQKDIQQMKQKITDNQIARNKAKNQKDAAELNQTIKNMEVKNSPYGIQMNNETKNGLKLKLKTNNNNNNNNN
mgnify:CR=1 FL=1